GSLSLSRATACSTAARRPGAAARDGNTTGWTTRRSSLLREAEDQARGAQRFPAFQRLEQLRPRHAGRELVGLERGRDHRHDVVLGRVAARRAGPEPVHAEQVLAGNEAPGARRTAELAFG